MSQLSIPSRNVILLAALHVFAAACSNGAGATAGAPGLGGAGLTDGGTPGTVVGNWGAKFSVKDADGTIPSGLKDLPATAQFAAADANSGTFSIALTDRTNAAAKGNYVNLQGLSLQLNLTDSTIPQLGNPGDRVVANYDILEPNMTIQNARFDIRLTRAATPGANGTYPGTNPTPAPSQPTTASDPLYAQWKCTDSLSHVWLLTLQSNNQFLIDILAQSADRAGLWLTGNMIVTRGVAGSDSDAVLTVANASDAQYQGMEIHASLVGPNGLLLRREVGGVTSATTNCARQ